MWREMRNAHARGSLLNHVPNRLFRNAVSPWLTCPTDTSEERAALDAGCGYPHINRLFHPSRDRNRPYMPSLANQIDYGPALVPTLQALQRQLSKLAAAQATPEQDGQDRSIAFSGKSLSVGYLPERGRPLTWCLTNLRIRSVQRVCDSRSRNRRCAPVP